MNDFSMFDAYRRQYTRNYGNHDYCDVDHLLRFWRENKAQYLQPLFGDKLILERPIEYTRSNEELYSDMEDMIDNYRDSLERLSNALAKELGVEDAWDRTEISNVFRQLRNFLYSQSALVENSVDMARIWYNLTDGDKYDCHKSYMLHFANGKKVAMQDGMKMTRLWGQIAQALNMQNEWEHVRIAHSQVLNQKKLKGTLCLSIHPLDYATASDNENGWSSCMSWTEQGCYRMGTVEMMNSPMVICAYLKSDKQHMEINGREWNSKKWRAWIIVTKDVILCNRHYPYHQPLFAETACNWVRDLVNAAYGWTYDEVHRDFYQYMRDTLGENEIEFHTNYMYNDLGGDDVIGMLRENKKHMPGIICFSGPAECMVCGEEIRRGEQEADCLECANCYAEYTCNECGCVLSEDELYTDPDGNYVCESCYNERCFTCSNCDTTDWSDNMVHLYFPMAQSKAQRFLKSASSNLRDHFTNWGGGIRIPSYFGEDVCLCEDCAQRLHPVSVEYDDETDDVNFSDCIDTVDPTKVSMQTAFDTLNVPGWSWATSSWTKRHHPDESKELIDFWTEQWDAFKTHFTTHPDRVYD